MRNEEFIKLTLSEITILNSDGSKPTQGSICSITNFVGESSTNQSPACANLTCNTATIANANIDSVTAKLTITESLTIQNTPSIRSGLEIVKHLNSLDCSGITAQYINLGSLLYLNNGLLQSNTDILGWKPSASVSTVSTMQNTITSLNTLILSLARQGIVRINNGATFHSISINPTGFTINITGTPSLLCIDGIDTTTTITQSKTNFPYILCIDGIQTPISIRNINSDPTDLANFYGISGEGVTSTAYYRATVPGKINYIILSVNQLFAGDFNISGSNASPTTPISFIYNTGLSFLGVSIKITDSGPHSLQFSSGSWRLQY